MQEVIFRVRSTEGHGLWEGKWKIEVEALPEIGDYATLHLIRPNLTDIRPMKRGRLTDMAGVIVERVTEGVSLETEDTMSPFHGAIIDCRWA